MATSKPRRVLTDPAAIKALAHPARLTVLEALGEGEELTATECAQVAGISPSAMSYHLRALEKWGFVERADASADGRERPWRATSSGWSVDAVPDQVAATAADAVAGTSLGQVRAELGRWFERERGEPKVWRDLAGMQNRRLWLTAEEATELQQLVDSFVERVRDRTATEHPDSARRVRSTWVFVPTDERASPPAAD